MFWRKIKYTAAVTLSLAALVCGGCVRDDVDEWNGSEYPEFGPEDYGLAIDFDLGVYTSDGGTRAGSIANITRVNFHPEADAFDYWEDYIDIHHEMETYDEDSYSLHVLMFDKDGNFLFNSNGVDNPYSDSPNHTNMFRISSTGFVENGELRRWRAVFQIPIEVREFIKDNPFKIAVFANWPTKYVDNPWYTRDDGYPEYPMPLEFWSDQPWGGEKYDPTKGNKPLTIRDLARAVWDSTYGGNYSDIYYIVTDMVDGRPKANDGSHMGPFTQWVLSYHSDQDAATSFTRGFSPDALGKTRAEYEKEWARDAGSNRLITPRVFRRDFNNEFASDDRVFIYPNLWNLWNFGGLYNANYNGNRATSANEKRSLNTDVYDEDFDERGNTTKEYTDPGFDSRWSPVELSVNYSDSRGDDGEPRGLDRMYYGSSPYVAVWASRNHRRARETFGNYNGQPLVDYVGNVAAKGTEIEIPGNSNGGFFFTSDFTYDKLLNLHGETKEPSIDNGALEYQGPDKAKLGKDDNEHVYLKLPANNDTAEKSEYKNCLHFKALATSTLYIKADNIDDIIVHSSANKFYERADNTGSTEPGANTWYLEVPADPADVWILSETGKAKIYEVECIQKKYLYDSDRRTLLPSSHQLIPMYGIQDFDPLGPYWIPGEVFDLSHDNGYHNPGYDYRTIYLLRSVARVEVLVSKKFRENAEAEGRDYQPRLLMRSMNRYARCMPLDVITPTNEIWDQVDQEILNIREHGPFYDTTWKNDKDKESDEFKNRLAWFYSRWEKLWGWDWNYNGTTATWQPTSMNRTIDPPMVYNAKISRSDFVRLIQVDDNYEGEYERYVMYMPEKAIDDATDAGELSGTPKVPHIEVRLKGESVTNLDDNKHDRIYFMDYAATGGPTPEEDKEYDVEVGHDITVHTYDNYEKSNTNLRKHWPVMRNHVYRFRVHPAGGDKVNVTLEVAGAAGRTINIPEFD